jgi:glutaredoxin
MIKKAKKTNKFMLAIIITIVIVITIIMYTKLSNSNNDKDNLAQCLTKNGAKLYGAYWCPHCKEQKDLFGGSFKYINYIECTEEKAQCVDIKSYPTWIINNQEYLGVKSLDQLKKLGGC